MKLLFLDVETAPNLGYVWSLFKQNIYPDQLEEIGYTMSYAAKWKGQKRIMFDSIYHSSPQHMLDGIWKLMSEADGIIHFNGKKFDIKMLNREFILHKMPPPEPYKQIDLLQVVRSQFRFHSNKLDEVCKFLGLDVKVNHKGFSLWKGCMKDDDKSWNVMRRYNKGDVKITEQLYNRLLPWVKGHPNLGLYVDTDRPTCSKCGSEKVSKQGTRTTATQVYQRYRCEDCFSWLSERTNSTPEKKKYTVLKEAHD